MKNIVKFGCRILDLDKIIFAKIHNDGVMIVYGINGPMMDVPPEYIDKLLKIIGCKDLEEL